MITKIENAMVDRLARGLGNLCNTVKTYSGELDDENLGTARLPWVLVSFGGANVERMGTSAKRHQSTATFVVLVAVNSLRSAVAGRQGGMDKREIGANQLIIAVRRLLDSQTLGGLAKPLLPVKVRTVLNHAKVKAGRLTAYSIEYHAVFDDLPPLEDGIYPEKTDDKSSPDYIFNEYEGETSEPVYIERIKGRIYDPSSAAEIGLSVNLEEKQ
ncbi:DUF1834 family protein [Actinobacillus sp. GY-402]|nr:DUF1834 family protein [Actinobacillus sp. GY-402]